MKILVLQTGFLGDVILSSPVFDGIKKIYPDSHLTVVTNPAAIDLVKYHPSVDDAFGFAKRGSDSGITGLISFARKLKAKNFDIVFSLHKSLRSAALLCLSRIPLRYGFSEASGTFFYHFLCPRKDLEHDVLRNLAIFRNLGKEPEEFSQRMKIGLREEWLSEAETCLAPLGSKPVIGLAPGSVWETKKWTEAGFSDLAELLAQDGFEIVLIGGPQDKKVAERIVESCKVPLTDLSLIHI